MKKGTKFKRIGAKVLSTLDPVAQIHMVTHGDKVPERLFHLIHELRAVVESAERQGHTLAIFRDFKDPKPLGQKTTIEDCERRYYTPDFLNRRAKEAVKELAIIVSDAALTGDPSDLRELADAIEIEHRKSTRDSASERRLFMIVRFRGFKKQQEFKGTFAQAREIIAERFDDYPDDAQLRKEFDALGIKFQRDKTGSNRERN